ncbi:IclR family transcriptional regulator [Pseudorhodoferax sp.]|uniref:IclR family transcriptional regulator n=1 Tax=Pseudorhodoferax sp. TaxID=1993553 RepID=UPI002DD66C8C|nr:helix-turn-helix domain-containing protein [Pseudorhodoferax sp.]
MCTSDSVTPLLRGAQSTARTLALLQRVARGHAEGVALRTLVADSGLDRTTAYRLLGALVQGGLVQREAGTVYRLGDEALALGLAALQRPPLVERCLPVMRALARRSGEPVFLVVRAGDHSHCLHLEQGPRPVRAFADSVHRLVLLGLGTPSFTFLAHMDDAALAAHYARHAEAYAAQRMGLAKMQRLARQARAQGYAQINAQGVGGVGVRFVLGSCGEAALGIVAPAARLPRARGPAMAQLLLEELRRL